MAKNLDGVYFFKISEKQVTKKDIFWENGYCFGYTCQGEKSYPWLKLSYAVLHESLNQISCETI